MRKKNSLKKIVHKKMHKQKMHKKNQRKKKMQGLEEKSTKNTVHKIHPRKK